MVSAREVRELLDERPELEPAIEAVLEPDPPWSFHDIDIDSGAFGELVAQDVVEKTDEGYRVADPEATRQALKGEIESETRDRRLSGFPEITLPITRFEAVLLAAALAMVVAFRLLALPTVYRSGHVVLSGNDPYFYRFWVEGLLANPEIRLSTLPTGVTEGEPLLVTNLWLAARLLGGMTAAGDVLAWYPVVSALLTAGLVHATAVVVTDDRRIGLAAVALLAVLPGHAFRTSLGFADHHAFDFLWLALTLFGLALVARAAHQGDSSPTTGLPGAVAVTVGVTGQTLAWDASPIIIAVIGPYLALEALRAVHRDSSPIRSLGPVLAGLGVASPLVWGVHARLGWHTDAVAIAPLIVLVAGIGVAVTAEAFRRLDLPATALGATEAGLAIVGTLAFRTLQPELWSRLVTSIRGRLLERRLITEVQSIFSDSFGWLLLFGFLLVLAVPYLVWATRRAVDDARWLPPVVYAWYFLALSAIQARFVGELSPALAIFAGLGLVHLAERIDAARPPAPFGDGEPPTLELPTARQAGYLVILFLLITGLSIVQVAVVTSSVTTPPQLAETAFYLDEYSENLDLEYPQNYVFSVWHKNRVYNYFVNGQAQSYGYAQNNFDRFLASTNPEEWYQRLRDRAGFVVVTDVQGLNLPRIGAVLYEANGGATENHPGLGHYRLIYVSEESRYKAFALVPGAVIQGQAAPNATLTATTDVSVPGTSFTYTRRTTANATGAFTLRVAYPGTYSVANRTVTVSAAAVRNGSTVDWSA